ncbi:hypothetical protein [Flavobacterium ajazii]|uniref:hypothetical protein n=1 Tax=Flavobacterium ajazii TaxID=2692318 RepID=UPI0013D7C2DC|nr:hypothetical protein [Flavobacterium ajazii]
MKNLKRTMFTTAFVLCCLTNVKAQDTKNIKEKTVKTTSVSELKAALETLAPTVVALDKRRLKTRHETAKNSINNVR